MRAFFLFLFKWLAVAALVVFGIWSLPESSDLIADRWKKIWPWLQDAWVAVAFFVTATILATLFVALPLVVRRYERKLAEELQRAKGENRRETDAGEVLTYIARQSAWGWRYYAKYNSWEQVVFRSSSELRAAAASGRVHMSGEMPNSNARIVPPSGYWRRAEIIPNSYAYGTYASLEPHGSWVAGETNLHHLRVSTYDYLCQWPRAGVWLRCAAVVWVAIKHAYYRLPEGAWPLRWYWWNKIDDNHAHEGPIYVRRKVPKP